MDKNDIIIKEYNSFSLLTCICSIDDYNIVACGDNKGRILIFDIREQKPLIKLICPENKNEINNIQYSQNLKKLFFSSENSIYSCDEVNNDYTKRIISKDRVKQSIVGEYEDGEINDFYITPDNNIIYMDMEDDVFLFYKKDENDEYKLNDNFNLSSAYGIEYINSSKSVVLYSFDGECIIYNYNKKETLKTIQIKKTFENNIDKDIESNYLSNPPFLNKIIYNPSKNELICAMMNGIVVAVKASNLKKTKLKKIHNGSINDIKLCKFNIKGHNEGISYGIDKCLKFIDLNDNFNIDYYADINCNLIDYDSDPNGNIYYIDDNSKLMYQMKIKN